MRKILKSFRDIGFIYLVLIMGFLTNPLGLGYVFGYLLVVTVVLKKKFFKRSLDLDIFLIFLFSFTYAAFYAMQPIYNVQTVLWYLFFPSALYLWGKYLAGKVEHSNFIYLLLSMGFIISVVALISVLLNIHKGGFIQGTRNIPFFWSKEPIPATGMAALLTLNMCIPAIVLANYKKFKKLLSCFLIILFVLSFSCVLRLGSRTQIAIFLITTVLALFYLVPKQSTKQNAILFIVIVILGSIVISKVSFDTNASWLNSYATRLEGNHSTIGNAGGRSSRWEGAVLNIFEKPLGWELNELGYIHNVWLDALRVSGIIPFFILLIYSVRSYNIVKKTISIPPRKLGVNVAILTYTVALFLLFMVEPVIDGSFMLFVTFCMFNGMVKKNYSKLLNKTP